MKWSSVVWGILIVSGCVLAAQTPIRASVNISPAYVQVRLDKGRPAGAFVVTNLAKEAARYRVQAVYFRFSREGGLLRVPPDENSLAGWIIFNPKEFTLAPRTRRTIRFVMAPRGRLKPGEYWAAMELEPLKHQVASSTDPAGRTMKVKVIATIMVPIFGQVGEINYSATLGEIGVAKHKGQPTIEALITNTGSGRLVMTGDYEIVDRADKVVSKGPCGKAYVLTGSERLFRSPLTKPLAPGTYTLRVRYTSAPLKTPLVKQCSFEWKPPPEDAAKSRADGADASNGRLKDRESEGR